MNVCSDQNESIHGTESENGKGTTRGWYSAQFLASIFDLLLLDWLLFLTAENGSASYDVSSVHCYK